MAQYERGLLHALNHVGHGEGLARAGDAEQHLRRYALRHAVGKLRYGLWLVAGGLVL